MLSRAMRYSFVAAYLGASNFEDMYDAAVGHRYRYHFLLRAAWQVAFVAAMWVYVTIAMPFPCETALYEIHNATVKEQRLGCGAETALRSPWMLMIYALLIPIANSVDGVVGFLGRNGCSSIATSIFSLQRCMGSKVPNLKYHKFSIEYGSVVNTYYVFIVQMLCVAAYLRSPMAVVVGKLVGDAMMAVANLVLGPGSYGIALIDRELQGWTQDGAAQHFLLRLCSHESDAIAVSGADVSALQSACQVGGRLERLLRNARDHRFPFCAWHRTEKGVMNQRRYSENFLTLKIVCLPDSTHTSDYFFDIVGHGCVPLLHDDSSQS